ncbi:MAG: hypothetical protein JXA57_08345 [Armatimonadetes bacterium]|nr:hypothetical protein [Armatimonadota bacterium]
MSAAEAPVKQSPPPTVAATSTGASPAGVKIICSACGTVNVAVPSLGHTACSKCGADLVQAAAGQRLAVPSVWRPPATVIVLLIAAIPFLLLVGALFHVALYATSPTATIIFEIILLAAIIWDIRHIVRQRRRGSG